MNKPIAIKWFPPSWVQLKIGDRIIYIDPAYLKTNFVRYPKRIEYSSWPDPIDGLPEELESADIILITHHHKDHCKRLTVRRLMNSKTKVFATKHCKKELGKHFTIVRSGIEIDMDDISLKTIAAYNQKQDRRTKLMHTQGTGVGYVISGNSKRIYHAGDTDLIPEMKQINHVDVAFLPIGGGGFTMDIHEAVEAAKQIKPKVIVPIHRFKSDTKRYKQLVENETSVRVKILDIGETLYA